MNADVSELLAYAHHIATAVDRTRPDFTRAVELGARRIQVGARQRIDELTAGVYLPHYPKSIGFDMDGPYAAEVGPDASKPQGGMGRGIEFGSAHTGPKPHMLPAADDEDAGFGNQVGAVFARGLR